MATKTLSETFSSRWTSAGTAHWSAGYRSVAFHTLVRSASRTEVAEQLLVTAFRQLGVRIDHADDEFIAEDPFELAHGVGHSQAAALIDLIAALRLTVEVLRAEHPLSARLRDKVEGVEATFGPLL
jgi:hypothetical protein